jgi:hypothetical protein
MSGIKGIKLQIFWRKTTGGKKYRIGEINFQEKLQFSIMSLV